MNRRPTITAEHVEAASTVQAMAGYAVSYPGVEVRVEYRHGNHVSALSALDRAVEDVRQQIAATINGGAVIVGGPDVQDERTEGGRVHPSADRRSRFTTTKGDTP